LIEVYQKHDGLWHLKLTPSTTRTLAERALIRVTTHFSIDLSRGVSNDPAGALLLVHLREREVCITIAIMMLVMIHTYIHMYIHIYIYIYWGVGWAGAATRQCLGLRRVGGWATPQQSSVGSQTARSHERMHVCIPTCSRVQRTPTLLWVRLSCTVC
jgi:hypothetical protein